MYHAMVKRQLRRAFHDLGRGNYETILSGMAPSFEHVFFGEHPLGGKRHTGTGYRLWFERLARLFPDLGFELRNIIVNGWPWDTVAAVEWTDHLTTRDGHRQENAGVHIIRMRWTKVTEIRIYCDNQHLAAICERQARHGVEDAAAGFITD
jgi:ketosteroid isomerase-like protein